jgi:hypothetical protein
MMTTRCRIIASAIVLATTPAAAQPAGAQAEVLFRQGREQMAAGKLAEACASFAESQKLEPAVGTLLNLAGCNEKRHLIASAWGQFLEAERQTRFATDAATKKLHRIAADHATKLEPRISKLTISVAGDSHVDGLEVLRDDTAIDPAMWNRALPIDGGRYTIIARAPGSTAWATQIIVAPEGDTKAVDVPKLATAPLPPMVPAPPHDVPSAAPARPHAIVPERSLAAPIALGAIAFGLAGGAVGFELWGRSIYKTAEVEPDDARQRALWKSANLRRYTAEGLGAASAIAAGVAIWLGARHVEPLVGEATGVAIAGRF